MLEKLHPARTLNSISILNQTKTRNKSKIKKFEQVLKSAFRHIGSNICWNIYKCEPFQI